MMDTAWDTFMPLEPGTPVVPSAPVEVLQIRPTEGAGCDVTVDKRTHVVEIPRDLETENQVVIRVRPKQ